MIPALSPPPRIDEQTGPDDPTDGQLLDRFLAGHEEAAFEGLLRRHGPMVLGVCRRVLRDAHDAEDAFQATFLVLARKGDSVRPREAVGHWLYGVAYRTALRARGANTRRKVQERLVRHMAAPQAVEEKTWNDLRPLLDRELDRLPEKYRSPIILCDLEGRSRKEAARQLGLPEGTVSSRLARGRHMLRRRLADRGLTLSAGVLVAALARGSACAAVPDVLLASTARAAVQFSTGQTSSSLVSAKVVSLAEVILKMALAKKLPVLAGLLAAVLAGVTIGGLPQRVLHAGPPDGAAAGAGRSGTSADRGLTGTWGVVSVEQNGVRLPDRAWPLVVFKDGRARLVTSEGRSLSGTYQTRRFRGLDGLDFTGDAGGMRLGIYTPDNNHLRICLAAPGGERPREFRALPASPTLLITLRRGSPS